MELSLIGVVYVSDAARAFDAPELQQLAIDAAQRNAEREVSGFLYYQDGKFLQYIEGADSNVSALMEKITGDPRHTVTHQRRDALLPTRRFPNWSMRRLTREKLVVLEELLRDIVTGNNVTGNNATNANSQRNNQTSLERRIWRMIELVRDYHDLHPEKHDDYDELTSTA